WLDVPADDLEQKVLSDVSADNAPDVVNLNTSFGASLAELDATTDMEEFVEEEDIDNYLEGAWEANQLDGETVGMQWYYDNDVITDNVPYDVNLNTSFGASLAELDENTDKEEFVEEEDKDKY